MFVLEGNRLKLDRPFTHKGLQYPKEWLRLSTPEQKSEIGIRELPDNTPQDEWDQDMERIRAGLIDQSEGGSTNHLIQDGLDGYPPVGDGSRDAPRGVCVPPVRARDLFSTDRASEELRRS